MNLPCMAADVTPYPMLLRNLSVALSTAICANVVQAQMPLLRCGAASYSTLESASVREVCKFVGGKDAVRCEVNLSASDILGTRVVQCEERGQVRYFCRSAGKEAVELRRIDAECFPVTPVGR